MSWFFYGGVLCSLMVEGLPTKVSMSKSGMLRTRASMSWLV